MEIDVSRAKLEELLAVGTEVTELDYKTTVDLDEHHERIELYKDVGAFMDHGGYIVIGADAQGVPTGGIQPGQEPLLDEARLRPALERYIPAGFRIVTRIHEIDGVEIGLIQVLPHPHGACVFHRQGEYEDPKTGKQVVVFREGEMFTRHGTSSERVHGQDLARIRTKDTTDLLHPQAEMDHPALREAVADALRRDDSIAMIDVLDELGEVAERASVDEHADELRSALDKLTTVAATAIKYSEEQWIPPAVDRLQAIYELGFRRPAGIAGGRARLWLDVVGRVMAVGPLVVAAGREDLVPNLVLRRPDGMDQHLYTNWIRHAGVEAARAGFFKANKERGEITFLRAVELEIGSIEAISKTFRSDDELRDALAQFDVLAAISVWGEAKDGDDEYPYWATFAGYNQHRYEPAIIRVVQDDVLRESLFGGTDDELRRVLRILEDQGRKHLAMYGGGGARYVAAEIHQFLND